MTKTIVPIVIMLCCCLLILVPIFGSRWFSSAPPSASAPSVVAGRSGPSVVAGRSGPSVVAGPSVQKIVRYNQPNREALQRRAEAAVLAEMDATLRLFIQTRSWPLVLKMAGIYEHGSYPLFRENPRVAQALYMAAATSGHHEVAVVARTKVLDVVAPVDSAGKPIPTTFGERMVREAIRSVDETGRARPAGLAARPVGPAARPVGRAPRPPVALLSSAQNVHDHGVVASLKQKIEARPKAGPRTGPGTTSETAEEEVLDAFLNSENIGDEIKSDAANFIVEGVDAAINESLGTSTRDALAATWERIRDIRDPEVRQNAVETLAMQCADGYNHGHMVCSSGRIARIVGALDGIDTESDKKILPTWVIKEEIASRAAAYARDGLDAKAFADEMTQTYVRDLGMSAEVIDPLIAMYQEHI